MLSARALHASAFQSFIAVLECAVTKSADRLDGPCSLWEIRNSLLCWLVCKKDDICDALGRITRAYCSYMGLMLNTAAALQGAEAYQVSAYLLTASLPFSIPEGWRPG